LADIITINLKSESIIHLCKKDKRLAKVIDMVGPITYSPYGDDPYAFLVHEIIEQMLSIKAGAKIYGRLQDLCNGDISPRVISQLSNEQLKTIGTSTNKVLYIRALTDSIISGSLSLDKLAALEDKDVIKQLTCIKGIGLWTAKMYLIFVLNRPDVLPTEDVAFLQSYKWLYKTDDTSRDSVLKRCKKWSPYSSIAARYLYRALDEGLVKKEFHLYK
jgi:DNA-3-methyladenine glycosylase II